MTRTNEIANTTEDGRDIEFLRQQERAAALPPVTRRPESVER